MQLQHLKRNKENKQKAKKMQKTDKTQTSHANPSILMQNAHLSGQQLNSAQASSKS